MKRSTNVTICLSLLSLVTICVSFQSNSYKRKSSDVTHIWGKQTSPSFFVHHPLLSLQQSQQRKSSSFTSRLYSSNDDEDDDYDYEDFKEDVITDEERARIESFRTQMMMGDMGSGGATEQPSKVADEDSTAEKGAGEGVISSVDDLLSSISAKKQEATEEETIWAKPLLPENASSADISKLLKGGVVLVANPYKFCSNFNQPQSSNSNAARKMMESVFGGDSASQPSPSLLSKFGLTLPPPAELGPDRRADLLPVLILLEAPNGGESQAFLMNRRTGYLLGDLETAAPSEGAEKGESILPKMGAFMIQPLWFGGTSSGGGGALDMLHVCPAVEGCQKLTDDGLYWSGDLEQAQDAMGMIKDKVLTGFDFKFFVQSTKWSTEQLEREIKDETWFMSSVSTEALFKSRDRLGAKRAKPLWTEIMELMGGKYQAICDELYNEEE